MPSHCDAVHCIELHCITLHHLTLQAYTHIVQIPVHTYVYIHTYLHIYIHIYIYIYLHIYIYIHIYIFTHIFIHTYIYIHIYIYIYTRMSMHMLNTNFIYPIIAVPTLPWMLGCWICIAGYKFLLSCFAPGERERLKVQMTGAWRWRMAEFAF